MSYNTQGAPASAARQMPQHLGMIANTLECSNAAWLGLIARLASARKAFHTSTFADAAAAIAAVDALDALDALDAQVRR
ncbi:hypothetical protein ACCQ14_17995 [Xanthomonas sp. NCPPB 2865]|uniref:hypothetical protein n=1 Tax=Xanthomonas TaxID=338 RepID=UPI000CEEB05F|nr:MULTISPECIES: hypothetical protein [Xanthomonas]PPU34967.1 hypothetical protein XarbCFBP7604_00530 [Xanthomonas arboricola]